MQEADSCKTPSRRQGPLAAGEARSPAPNRRGVGAVSRHQRTPLKIIGDVRPQFKAAEADRLTSGALTHILLSRKTRLGSAL